MKKLYVAGIGPGDPQTMTAACRAALEEASVIVGYTKYVELVAPLYPAKRRLSTGMTQEAQRCRAALALAAEGETVALVCGGDPGVYSLAALVYELAQAYPAVDIEIVPGVTAALAGAALLGAPLTHDFAVVSLSDLLTPWPLIERRLDCAAAGDFCLALYNPSSKKRAAYLPRACDILLRHKPPQTPCGLVRNLGRPGQGAELLLLEALGRAPADMCTTVFVGNSQTKIIKGKLVTPRGYCLD
jgi:precorrin-3B C17-methyltransferase